MHLVKATRQAAVKAAQDAFMEKVQKSPEKVMEGMLKAPHLLFGIQEIDKVFDVLLEKGMYDQLMQLADSRSLPKYIRPILVGKLL